MWRASSLRPDSLRSHPACLQGQLDTGIPRPLHNDGYSLIRTDHLPLTESFVQGASLAYVTWAPTLVDRSHNRQKVQSVSLKGVLWSYIESRQGAIGYWTRIIGFNCVSIYRSYLLGIGQPLKVIEHLLCVRSEQVFWFIYNNPCLIDTTMFILKKRKTEDQKSSVTYPRSLDK